MLSNFHSKSTSNVLRVTESEVKKETLSLSFKKPTRNSDSSQKNQPKKLSKINDRSENYHIFQ